MTAVGVADFVWDRDPADGVVCLLSTRRVLDAEGHCCDYNRCPARLVDGRRVLRCQYAAGHDPSVGHHASWRRWGGHPHGAVVGATVPA